jgi:hypothetical protein
MAKKSKTIDGKKYYQQAFAISGKAGDPETWKLPHHVSGDRPHDRLGVDWERLPLAAGAAASGQFRGQALDATAAERKRAARHLLAHYRKAKKDPPKSLLAFLGLKERAMARRKIGKGKPLTELVKGSKEYTLNQIAKAFRAVFSSTDDWFPYIVETFEDYLIVHDNGLSSDEYYRVSYERKDGEYVFASRNDWEIVELTYQPQTMSERRRGSDNLRTRNQTKRFEERIDQRIELLESEDEEGPRRVRAVGITADVVNANDRRYPKAVLQQALQELRGHLHESAGQGRLKQLLGEAEHPSDKPTQRPNLLETVIVWEQADLPGDQVILEGRLLETSKGKDVQALIAGGVQVGVSQRAWGESRIVREGGKSVEEVTELHITGYDLVLDPSDPNGGIDEILERKEYKMDPEEILRMLRESGEFDKLREGLRREIVEAMRAEDRDRQMKALREALGLGPGDDLMEAMFRLAREHTAVAEDSDDEEQTDPLVESLREVLGLGEGDDLEEAIRTREGRRRELEEAARTREIESFIEQETAGLKYPDRLQERLVEAVKAAGPKTVEEAKGVLQAKREEYDALMAELELMAKGYRGIQVKGPVLERELGVPEFARGAHEITESLARSGDAVPRKWDRQLHEMTAGERFAKHLLERFDRANKAELLRESQVMVEAEQTSDLSLPYSVSRAVIAEVVPNLVAASIFDVGVTEQSEFRLYFESYAGETGASAAVSKEQVTIAALGTWYGLANKRVQVGTVVVTDNAEAVTYTEGTDYAVDYANGKVLAISGGGISASDVVKVSYTYDAIRKGEMQAIERGKVGLSFVLVTAVADRLATQISDEAIKFSRSQIGWDATGRTLAALIRQIREKIDQGMMYLGLGKALSVANNVGGTWSATPAGGDTYDENLDKLFRYIGAAKVLVANRYYEPNFILTSITNGDLMSNSKQFTAAGKRPDADLNAAGYVGRAKGLPIFSSPLFTDGWILVGNRELVMYRVYEAMVLKGPFPSYDVSGGTSKIVAADQYYAEEYNVTEAPVAEKGAVVKLTS